MSNGREVNVYERMWKLWTMICKMVMDGTRDATKVAEVLQSIVSEAKVYLRPILLYVPLGPTNGTETLESSGLFSGEINGLDLLKTPESPTPAGHVTIYKMVEGGKLSQLCGSLGENRRRIQVSQVTEFCRKNGDKLRFREGYYTFFELEGGLVIHVYLRYRGGLRAAVYPLHEVDKWGSLDQVLIVALQE